MAVIGKSVVEQHSLIESGGGVAKEHESYIQKYLRFNEGNEAPNNFHMWCAASTIAFAVGRSIWIDYGFESIYPNQYTILVAGSGACRKGLAVGVARRLLRDAIGNRLDKLLIPGKVYPEALIRAINKRVVDPRTPDDETNLIHRSIMLFSPELGSFLSKTMQSMGMPDLLTELWDCPDEHKHVTKNAGVDELHDVFINLLGATTPKWMQDNMTPSIFGEGFIARCLLVYAAHPKNKTPWPEMTDEMNQVRDELIMQLRLISLAQGPMGIEPEAKEFFTDWYIKRTPDDDISSDSGFWQREHIHILNLAMIFSLSADPSNMSIYKPHLVAAMHAVQQVKSTMHLALAGTQAEPNQRNMMRVLSTVKEQGKVNGITARELGRRLIAYMDPETLITCLTGLRANGMIESQQRKTQSGDIYTFYRVIRYGGRQHAEPDTGPWQESAMKNNET